MHNVGFKAGKLNSPGKSITRNSRALCGAKPLRSWEGKVDDIRSVFEVQAQGRSSFHEYVTRLVGARQRGGLRVRGSSLRQ
jgi:hypothetical protein